MFVNELGKLVGNRGIRAGPAACSGSCGRREADARRRVAGQSWMGRLGAAGNSPGLEGPSRATRVIYRRVRLRSAGASIGWTRRMGWLESPSEREGRLGEMRAARGNLPKVVDRKAQVERRRSASSLIKTMPIPARAPTTPSTTTATPVARKQRCPTTSCHTRPSWSTA